MKKGGDSESIIIIGPSKSVLVRAPQLRKRPRPCPVSGVRAKIIIIILLLGVFQISNKFLNFNFCNASLVLIL